MRILVISNFFPPVAQGGYEIACAGVVEQLRLRHEVQVLTASAKRRRTPLVAGVRRELPRDHTSKWTVLKGPLIAARAAHRTRIALREVQPDVVYAWGMSSLPDATLRVCMDSRVPL